jgi:hypothetical protein
VNGRATRERPRAVSVNIRPTTGRGLRRALGTPLLPIAKCFPVASEEASDPTYRTSCNPGRPYGGPLLFFACVA